MVKRRKALRAGAGQAGRTRGLIWERVQQGKAARRLDVAMLVPAAVAIADDRGLDEVSMRALAARLGVGTMSLYRHVRDKDEIHDLILDAAFGEIALPQRTSGDWRRDVTRVFTETRRVLRRHPWLSTLLVLRPTLGPNYLEWIEFLLAATAAGGRPISTQMRMIGTLWAFVSGFVAYEVAEAEANRRSGLSEADKRASVAPYLESVLATGRFPQLARLFAARADVPSDRDFEFGLRAVLDGLDARVSRPA